MHLTRMALNPARRGTKFLLASPQAMHAAVLSSFPPGIDTDTEQGRVLWRVDHQHPHLFLYIVSPAEPNLEHLVEQAGWPTTGGWETTPYERLLSQIEDGKDLRFRLTANPVKQSRDPQLVGKRLAHVTATQQRNWLVERSERHGFRIPSGIDGEPDVMVTRRMRHEFRRGDQIVTLATAQFDGRLEVVDAELFRDALTHGIGRAKGYGCGLLTIAGVSHG